MFDVAPILRRIPFVMKASHLSRFGTGTRSTLAYEPTKAGFCVSLWSQTADLFPYKPNVLAMALYQHRQAEAA